MDIFKLGDKILALLEAVFGFWNNQISLVFAMLGQSVESAKESSKYLREIGKYHFVLALAAAEVVAAGVPRKVIRKINFILNVKFEKRYCCHM